MKIKKSYLKKIIQEVVTSAKKDLEIQKIRAELKKIYVQQDEIVKQGGRLTYQDPLLRKELFLKRKLASLKDVAEGGPGSGIKGHQTKSDSESPATTKSPAPVPAKSKQKSQDMAAMMSLKENVNTFKKVLREQQQNKVIAKMLHERVGTTDTKELIRKLLVVLRKGGYSIEKAKQRILRVPELQKFSQDIMNFPDPLAANESKKEEVFRKYLKKLNEEKGLPKGWVEGVGREGSIPVYKSDLGIVEFDLASDRKWHYHVRKLQGHLGSNASGITPPEFENAYDNGDFNTMTKIAKKILKGLETQSPKFSMKSFGGN
jgi:hypothetical protein